MNMTTLGFSLSGSIQYLSLCVYLISFSIMSSRFIHVACIKIFFLRLNNPKYVYAIICLSIHPLIDIWVVSTFWLLWIMLLWTLLYKYLFGSLFLDLLVIYVRVKLLGHMIVPCLPLWWTPKLCIKHFIWGWYLVYLPSKLSSLKAECILYLLYHRA